jgi:hypothetical protein
MQLPGPFRLAGLAVIGLALLFGGCASPWPGIADETKFEEWGRCSQAQPHFTVLCLQMRRLTQLPRSAAREGRCSRVRAAQVAEMS